jgi:hypothetical protein
MLHIHELTTGMRPNHRSSYAMFDILVSFEVKRADVLTVAQFLQLLPGAPAQTAFHDFTCS